MACLNSSLCCACKHASLNAEQMPVHASQHGSETTGLKLLLTLACPSSTVWLLVLSPDGEDATERISVMLACSMASSDGISEGSSGRFPDSAGCRLSDVRWTSSSLPPSSCSSWSSSPSLPSSPATALQTSDALRCSLVNWTSSSLP
eukprot:CAMPEP_0183384280 /NCGR_PEP_ID=MMETSP0370-20130417/393_1 /TAXON_ID=268820 /ORGANISM="Peridinium aciculiferum, Strain PAER-2" /LENGTH=146 /DNA_ID=CAMNT_0025561987 /DNA_START=90 /DNA_END=526 /DNA_ORIENTATION=-